MIVNMEPHYDKLFGRKIFMNQYRLYPVGALLIALCTVSCISNPPRDSNGGGASAEPAVPPAANTDAVSVVTKSGTVDAAQLEHLQKAIGSLHVGRVADAKSELAAVLKQDPANKDARSLLAQIQTDPVRYFGGPESFNYTLQQGETLSNVAQRFLDEPLKFYILARFNGVSDPSRLTPGRTIKVPGRKVANTPNPGTSNSSTPNSSPPTSEANDDARVPKAKRLYDAGKYQQAIDTLEEGPTGNGEARDLLSRSYAKVADEFLVRQDFDAAHAVLVKAVSKHPTNDNIRKQLKYVEQKRAIAANYKVGMDAAAAGDIVKALEAFTSVQKLDPGNEEVQKQIAAIKDNAIESMHREALFEYNKQNLDKAIDMWDRVLALLPTHNNARLYRSRAIDLKSRLLQLESKN